MATYNIPIYLNDKDALVYLKKKDYYNDIAKASLKQAIKEDLKCQE